MAAVTVQRVVARGLDIAQLTRRFLPPPSQDPEDLLALVSRSVRFRAHLSYKRPSHELAKVEVGDDTVTFYVNDFVLAGLLGPLPAPYFEFCFRRSQVGDHGMAAFLDIFNHRIHCLRYCQKARYLEGLDPAPLLGLASQFLAAVSGGPSIARHRDDYRPLGLRRLVGLVGLLLQMRSREVLERILEILFGMGVRILSFMGSWLPIHGSQQIALGRRNSRLGRETLLGKRAWSQDSGIAVHLFVDRAQFNAFLPGGERHAELAQTILWLTQHRFDLHVSLHCTAHPSELAATSAQGPRLGYSAWLSPADEQRAQTVHFKIPAQGGRDE